MFSEQKSIIQNFLNFPTVGLFRSSAHWSKREGVETYASNYRMPEFGGPYGQSDASKYRRQESRRSRRKVLRQSIIRERIFIEIESNDEKKRV